MKKATHDLWFVLAGAAFAALILVALAACAFVRVISVPSTPANEAELNRALNNRAP